MKYFLILLLGVSISCSERQIDTTLLALNNARDTVYLLETYVVTDTIEVVSVRIKKELYCPFDLNDLEASKTTIAKLSDSIYNLQVLQSTLLNYTPAHIQEAFKK